VSVPVRSLSSIEDASTYFDGRLYATAWTDSDEDRQQKALNDATRIINLFQYKGQKTESGQLDQWPRQNILVENILLDKTVTPDAVLIAQYEIAYAVLDGYDPERDLRSINVTSRGISSARIAYDSRAVPEHLMYGVPSALAWVSLLPFLERDMAGTIKLHRVS
jgi:hypothetical protein